MRIRRRYNADPMHPIRLYNSLTRQVETLEPIHPGRITIYTCGSTVYRYAHIGNLRTYLFGDLLRRTLAYLGYEVLYVKNITDVGHMRHDLTDTGEDRMEQAAIDEGKSPAEIADFYTAAWLEDERLINILPADVMPKATDHIAEMIAMIETLLARGLAYRVDGNVYYDVAAFPGYGRLSGQRVDATRAGHRVAVETDKRSPQDFALWKAAEPGRVMNWPSPWGAGLPGLAYRVLGDEHEVPRRAVRHPHRRDRPEVPAPRGRDRAGRGGDRAPGRQPVDAR